MTNKVLLSLATVALFAATAQADEPRYVVETTNSWFAVDASENDLTTNWSGAERTKETTFIKVDTPVATPAKYATGVAPSATRLRVKGHIENLVCSASAPTVFPADSMPQAAITATNNVWFAWHCTNDTAGAWVEMSGSTPVENADYDVTIEFKENQLRYGVGSSWLTAALITDGNGWMSSATNYTKVAAVGLAGYGTFGDFSGLSFEEFDVVVDASAFSAMDITTDGKTPAQISAALNEKGTNGLTKWESIVLGLKSASTKPYTAPVQTSGNTLGFTIGNVDTSKYGATGATVTFDVVECNSDGSDEQTIEEATANNVAAGGTATVTAPSGVKYYKIKVKITK